MVAQHFARSRTVHLPVFPRLIVEHLVRLGCTDEQIFAGLSFSSQDLASDAFRLDPVEHEAFIRRALELTGNIHLALEMQDQAADPTSNAFTILLVTSGHLSRALELIVRYSRILTRTLTVRLEKIGSRHILTMEPHLMDPVVNYFALTSFALFVDNVFKSALGGRSVVTCAELTIPEPEGFSEVRSRFSFDLQFGRDRNSIHLDPDLLEAPLGRADPQTTRLITDFCDMQLHAAQAEVSTVAAAKALVVEHLSAPLSLDQVASVLGLSSRSFRRHLQGAGTTYKAILNDVRKGLAVKLLRETDEPISSIAYEVGFEHPSHFGRAFKTWTGQSPSQFRQQSKL